MGSYLDTTLQARWLFWPVVFVAAYWCLLCYPERLLHALPVLWSTTETPKRARGPLAFADMTAEEMVEEWLEELDARRTVYDRVGGWLLVVILWGGLVALMVPVVTFCCGPLLGWLRRAFTWLAREFHLYGGFEVGFYLIALSFAVQGHRYPPSHSAAGLTSLAGGLGFVPCWVYSTTLHATEDADRWGHLSPALTLGLLLESLVLLPLALLHQSPHIGFLAVACFYGFLAAAVRQVGCSRQVGGFDAGSGTHCCTAASALLLFLVLLLRATRRTDELKPFVLGLTIFGHCGYFVAILCLASGWRSTWETFIGRQVFAIVSAAVAFCAGHVWSAPALVSSSFLFSLSFALSKEWESKHDHTGVKILATYVLLQYLYGAREYFFSVLDPTNLYV